MNLSAFKVLFRILAISVIAGGTLMPISAQAQTFNLTPFEPCETVKKAPCIESFFAISPTGKRIKITPGGPSYTSVDEFAMLKSTPFTIYQWRSPGITHENGTELLTLKAHLFPLGAPYCWAENKCVNDVEEIWVYLFASGWDAPAPYVDFPETDNDYQCGTLAKPEKCVRMWGLNPDYKYEITLRPSPDFTFSHANGEAVDGSVRAVNSTNGELLVLTASPADFSYKIISEIRPDSPTRNKADISYKYIGAYLQSTRGGQAQWLKRCDYGKELSLWYTGQLQSMPMWSPTDQSLSIQVSNTHLKADGSVNRGVFNIEMPIETAKCLWGVDLSKAVSASLSAIYPISGETEIITTTSQVSGKFFKVSAAGFHYSTPTLKLKVFQDNPVPAPATKGVPKQATKKTITCAKGKVTKTFTAANPKCPPGYKTKK